MDPLAILAIAKTSYAAIKGGIAVGKEIQGMVKDVSSLWKACADLTQMAAKPPASSVLSGKSLEQVAMEAYVAKAEAEKLLHEIKMDFISQHGLNGWESVQSLMTEMKKEQRREKEEQENRRRELIETISLILTVLLGLVIVGGIIVLIVLFLALK